MPAAKATPDRSLFDKPFDFIPVPSKSNRHDGWTPERQHEFMIQLAQIGLVGPAARAVGMSAKSAYKLRERDTLGSFRAAWDLARQMGLDHACDHSIEYATNGKATPIFYGGRQVGERRHYPVGLMIAALRLLPGYGATGRPLDTDDYYDFIARSDDEI